ncbi:MAG: glycosyltransferase family 1 protein [Flavobacteriales bacterium]|nr:glycosyltransferase family 1 protein [Flavobacteriales bacterium]
MKKLRITVLGSNNIWSIENHYIKYFIEAGHEVNLFANHTLFLEWHQKSVLNKVLFKLLPKFSLSGINKKILDFVKKNPADIILIFKGMEIFPETVKALHQIGSKLINYNPDHPFEFHGIGSGNKFVRGSIPFYHLYLTYSYKIATDVENKYGVKAGVVPFGYEITEELLQNSIKASEINRLCFLGNPDSLRADFLCKLSKKGIPVSVYGLNWKDFFDKDCQIEVHDRVHGQQFWEVLRKYRIQLNLFRSHNTNSHNMRSFEVPAVGGIMLAPKTDEHSIYFETDKEAFYYENFKECLDKCNYILNLSESEANSVRDAAIKRSASSAYTYKDKAHQMLDLMIECLDTV